MITHKGGGAERRRHERFSFKDRVFITFRPQYDRIGWVTDISKGGVSMEYATIQEYSELTDNLKVDIFSSPRKFEMSNLNCRLVYDDRAYSGIGLLESIETRRCGLVFDELSQQQTAELDAMLSQCEPIKNNA